MCSWKGVVVLTFVDLAAVDFWQGTLGGRRQEWEERSETEEREGGSKHD